MELGFKVQISGVRAKGLQCPGRTPDSFPLFRLNFDEKVIESDLYQGAGDPEWQTKASFEYRLREGSLQEAITSLSMRRATLEIAFVDMRGGRESKVGQCAVDLYTVCTGPHLFVFTLQSANGSPAGTVYFSLTMEQHTTVQIDFQNVDVSGLPAVAPYRLAYQFANVSGRDVETTVLQPTNNPQWTSRDLPRLEIRSTLRALLSSTIRVFVEDMSQRAARIVAFDLPLKELITSNTNSSVPFKRNAYGSSQPNASNVNFAALATGVVQFSNLPIFAQFEKGENQQGNVHGKPLMSCLPAPNSYSKVPKRLPDMRPGQAQFELAQHSALQPNLVDPAPINAWGAQPLPAHPQGGLAHYPVPPPHPPGNAVSSASSSVYVPQPPPQPPQPHYSSASYHAVTPPPQHSYHHGSFADGMHTQRQPTVSYPPQHQPRVADVPPPPFATTPNYQSSYQHQQYSSELAGLRTKSPLAHAGDSLIRQHQDTVSAVEQQQRRVQALAQELHERTVTEVALSEQRARELDLEEQRVRDDLRRIDRTVEDLRRMKEEHDVSHSVFLRKAEADRVALVNELEDLNALHAKVSELAKQIVEHAQEDERIKERARLELESARSRFHMDARDLGEVETKIQYRLGQPAPPAFTSASIHLLNSPGGLSGGAGSGGIVSGGVSSSRLVSQAPLRASPVHSRPRAEIRSISPPRPFAAALHSASSSIDIPPEQQLSSFVAPPRHADVDDLLLAIRSCDMYRFQQVMKRAPKAIFESDNVLHIACAVPAPDFEIVSAIVYYRPELISGVDTSSGSTALHFACASSVISLPTVDLLLSKGASVKILDNDGLSPFHVAARNLADTTHALKKLLLFKGGADVNGVTGRGESCAHLLCMHDRYLESLKFLARYGANLNAVAKIPNADNVPVLVTPLEKARWYGPAADECRRFLERGGN